MINYYLADEPKQRRKDFPFWNMFKLVVLHLTKLKVILEPNDETKQKEFELCIKKCKWNIRICV